MWYALLVVAVVMTVVAYRARGIIARYPTSEFDPITAYMGTDLAVVCCATIVLLVVLGNLASTPAAGRAGRLNKTAIELASREEVGRQLAVMLATAVRRDREHQEALVQVEGRTPEPKPAAPAAAKPASTKPAEARPPRHSSASASEDTEAPDDNPDAAAAAAAAKTAEQQEKVKRKQEQARQAAALRASLTPIEGLKVLLIYQDDTPPAYQAAIKKGLLAGFAECRLIHLDDPAAWQEAPLRGAPGTASAKAPPATKDASAGTDARNPGDDAQAARAVSPPLTIARLDELHARNRDCTLIISLVNLPADYARSQTAADVGAGDAFLAVLSSSAFNLGEQIFRRRITGCIAPIPVSFREEDYDEPIDADTFEAHYIVLTADTVVAAVALYPRLFPVIAAAPGGG